MLVPALRQVVECPSLEIFRTELKKALSRLIQLRQHPSLGHGAAPGDLQRFLPDEIIL